MRKPQIAINDDIYNFLKKEAKKNRRTIQGQTEIMLEMARRQIEDREKIIAGATQINAKAFGA